MAPTSSELSARGVGIGCMPVAVNIWFVGATADGATGWRWWGVLSGWEIRPTCMSWTKTRPPAAWTASVVSRQPCTCSGVCRPGVVT